MLGLKGALSEAELGLIVQRAQQGPLSKAKRGELYTTVAIGYVRTRDDGLERDPNRRVRESIQGVFDKMTETGSARQTLLWYRQEKIRLPARRYGRWGWETVWKAPVYNTILKFLKNPIHAGVYVWGRTTTETVVEDGQVRKRPGKLKAPGEWTVRIEDHHPGCIDVKMFERNQEMLRDNANMKGVLAKGAARSGRSLLAGLLQCGHCGRRLHVGYSGLGGRVPRYSCQGALLNHGGERCISFGGLKVDRAIEAEILRAVQPAAIEAALAAADQARGESQLKRRLLEREVEQLRYEAERAYRQYDAVDPANRLVAGSLERKWDSALERLRSVETRLRELNDEAEKTIVPDKESLRALAESFPRVWADPKSDMKIKKRIARMLIEEIVARVDEPGRQVLLTIRWKGGKHTRLQVKKNRTGRHGFSTDKEIVELVRELATAVPDRDIARILNRLGKKTGKGLSWKQSRVCWLRNYNQIPVFDPKMANGEFRNMAQAAAELGISPMSVRRLIAKRILPARQIVPLAPWQIGRKDLQSEVVMEAVRAVKSRKKVPPPENPAQLKLVESTT